MAGTLALGPMMPAQGRVCVWRLGISEDLFRVGEFEVHTSLAACNGWQRAQRGVFTRLNHEDHGDIASYLEYRGKSEALTQFTVPASEAFQALYDLEAMNITFATLYPDLRAAALQANVGPTWSFG